jgi:hypothetical protein
MGVIELHVHHLVLYIYAGWELGDSGIPNPIFITLQLLHHPNQSRWDLSGHLQAMIQY